MEDVGKPISETIHLNAIQNLFLCYCRFIVNVELNVKETQQISDGSTIDQNNTCCQKGQCQRVSAKVGFKINPSQLLVAIGPELRIKYKPNSLTWVIPCCRALPAGSWSYWRRDPGTPGCLVWQCLVGCVTGSCQQYAGQSDGWERRGLGWDSLLGLRQKKHGREN